MLASAVHRLVDHPALRKGAPIVVLLLAIVLPRAIALRGVSMSAQLQFADMPLHLINLDKLDKLHRLDRAQLEDPFFELAPRHRELFASQRWPLSTYRVGRHFSAIFGPLSIWTTQLTNLVFTLLLVLAVYGLGAAMADRSTGWWAALLTALSPPLVASSFYFSLDFPLTAVVLLALLLLWRTRGLTRPWVCAAFGATCALGISIKPAFPLYLAIPSLWALVHGLRGGAAGPAAEQGAGDRGPLSRLAAIQWPFRRRRARVGAGALLALAVALPLTWLLYAPELGTIVHDAISHFSPPAGAQQEYPAANIAPWTAGWALALPAFAAMNFPWPLLLLALPGFVLLHWRRHALAPRGLLLAALWGGYLILTLMENKLDRYLHPLYPLFCLLTAWGLARLVSRRWRTAALTWVAALYLAVLCVAHVHPPPWGRRLLSPTAGWDSTELHMPGRALLAGLRRNTFHPTCRLAPLVEGIAALLEQDRSSRPLGVALVPELVRLGGFSLNFENLAVLTAQQARDRLVFPFDLKGALAPSVVLVHKPDVDPRRLCPQATVAARRSVVLTCGEQTELRLSLLRPRTPGARCGE